MNHHVPISPLTPSILDQPSHPAAAVLRAVCSGLAEGLRAVCAHHLAGAVRQYGILAHACGVSGVARAELEALAHVAHVSLRVAEEEGDLRHATEDGYGPVVRHTVDAVLRFYGEVLGGGLP
jgi:hypothetical protein